MVAPHTTPADLAAAAASLLWWAPQFPGEQLGVEPIDPDRAAIEPFITDKCRGGFVATVLPDEHGAPHLGWLYEGWLFVGTAGADLVAGTPGPSDLLKSQLGPRCLRVHARLSVPPWVRVSVELRGERSSSRFDPYRTAAPRPVWEGDNTLCRVASPLPKVTDALLPGAFLVILRTDEPTMLGKRFPLEHSATRIGRGADNHIVLGGDAVSRRHACVEIRGPSFVVVDLESMHGVRCNDELIARESVLRDGDRIKVGQTIFRFLAGADIDAKYHEEIYQMTITDGLTQLHNRRYFHEALDREIARSRKHERDLAILMFAVDGFESVIDDHGNMAGDFVLRELARLVLKLKRHDQVLARHAGEEFAFLLAETSLTDADALAETLQQTIAGHVFTYGGKPITLTVRTGTAALVNEDRGSSDLLKRATEHLALSSPQR
jgi:diguanylate cyclase (GGDEF)-like protein